VKEEKEEKINENPVLNNPEFSLFGNLVFGWWPS
jgi:hypothetical protein